MNPRSPVTPGGAFARAKDILSAKVLAQFLKVSDWTIYDRCSAQIFKALNLSADEMLEIDLMCKQECGEAPLGDWYNQRVDQAPGAPIKETLESAGLKLASEVGQVEAKILSIRQDGARGVSNRKGVELLTELRDVKRCVDDLENLVEKETGAA